MEAARLFKEDQGSLSSYAVCLFNGMGVQRNLKAAVGAFFIVANADEIDALTHLGEFYTQGLGVAVNLE